MKFFHNIYSALLVLIFSVAVLTFSLFHYSLAKVSDNSELKEVIIEPGSVDSIATVLQQKNLIKNKFTFMIYVKLSGKTNLKAATYSLSENMGVKKIVDILYAGSGKNSNQISMTFKEGINVPKIAKLLAQNTNHTEEEFYTLLKNEEYLKTLIQKYWFLTDQILNQEIYYSLEGYLYPDTYYFSSKDVSLEKIVETMLDETEKRLKEYKERISTNAKNIHEIIILASIVELEGTTEEDRQGIVQVFLNRLEANMNLGSDVTTYYGAKVEMGERDLYSSELNACNQYNTRCPSFKKLPISPICNPSIHSVVAVLEAKKSDYLYFVADKNKKIYFSKTIEEHNRTIANLKANNLWYEY